ncbi:MAG: galactokinase [Planctomycetota bacterium]|nr:galactokinase [Planctomycetota bacterium]
MPTKQLAVEAFQSRFNEEPAHVVRAPGRVNIIGEHTDYNDGFVMPMAIDRAVWIAFRPRNGDQVSVVSTDFEDLAEFSLDALSKGEGWGEYLKGVANVLQEEGLNLNGWEGVVASDVPIGAGLSSSAALELATARAFCTVSGFDWAPRKMALLGQKAENQWVGVNCGIMDQMISATGQDGHAVLIDCRSLELKSVPLPPGTSVVVLDTATRRGLVDSAYNERRSQCERAAEFFGAKVLRDVSSADLKEKSQELDTLTLKRARHVVTENERTVAASEAMQNGDANKLGELMNQSHESLKNDFEVSSKELDAMVGAARAQSGCFGARMTGAGFGGCAAALVNDAEVDAFVPAVGKAYCDVTGHTPSIYVCRATDGAGLISEGN